MSKTYILDSSAPSTWQKTGGSAIELVGATTFTVNETGNTVDLNSDGFSSNLMTFIDGKSVDMTIELVDAELPAAADFRVGIPGQLILKATARGPGSSAASPANPMVITVAEAVITGVSSTVSATGISSTTISFRGAKSTGAAILAYS